MRLQSLRDQKGEAKTLGSAWKPIWDQDDSDSIVKAQNPEEQEDTCKLKIKLKDSRRNLVLSEKSEWGQKISTR